MRFVRRSVPAAPIQAHAGTQLFVEKHYVVDTDLSGDRRECRRQLGIYEEGYCSVPAKNTVTIAEKNGTFAATVETYGTDLDSCHLQGDAVRRSAGHFTVIDESGACRVEIKIRGRYASVENSGDDRCAELCGMHASLEIARARRLK